MPLPPCHVPCSDSGRNRYVANSRWKSRRSRSAIAVAWPRGPARPSARAPSRPSRARCATWMTSRSCAAVVRRPARRPGGGARAARPACRDGGTGAPPQASSVIRARVTATTRSSWSHAPARTGNPGSAARVDQRRRNSSLTCQPSASERPRVVGEEAVQGSLVTPLREDGQPAQLQAVGDTVGAPSRISDGHSAWSIPATARPGGRSSARAPTRRARAAYVPPSRTTTYAPS